MLRYANLCLFVLFPVSWFAPLMRAGLLPFFELDEISIATGLQALWTKDILLALVVASFALAAPMAKTLVLTLVQFGYLGRPWLRFVRLAGRFAMADIFLVALYIILAEGVGLGRVETAWGLYLFSACVLASLALSHLAERDASD
ncbi:MAG: paraquat-inducible protein A [Rhodobacteraceae bacterium]|nr:paraquat-inducible protein A [Paracoccaceae bacterium]